MASSNKKKAPAPAAKKGSAAKSAKPAKPAAKSAKPVAKSARSAAKPAPRAVKSSAPAKKAPAKKAAGGKSAISTVNGHKMAGRRQMTTTQAILGNQEKKRKLDPFTQGQREKLLQLRDAMVDSMAGVAQDTLRSRAEGSEASAFGMHQADAGSDAYDRDFALSLLSQEQDALYEIDQALKRIDLGTYGVCEMSGKPIGHARLEAIPFARFTVECQSQLEKQNKASRVRHSVTSLFGLTDDEGGDGEEEESKSDRDDNKE
jgi:RNA polymerase-binding transcription factor DksA